MQFAICRNTFGSRKWWPKIAHRTEEISFVIQGRRVWREKRDTYLWWFGWQLHWSYPWRTV